MHIFLQHTRLVYGCGQLIKTDSGSEGTCYEYEQDSVVEIDYKLQFWEN